jgi:hypothetical protein
MLAASLIIAGHTDSGGAYPPSDCSFVRRGLVIYSSGFPRITIPTLQPPAEQMRRGDDVGKRPTIHVCDIIVADDMFAL